MISFFRLLFYDPSCCKGTFHEPTDFFGLFGALRCIYSITAHPSAPWVECWSCSDYGDFCISLVRRDATSGTLPPINKAAIPFLHDPIIAQDWRHLTSQQYTQLACLQVAWGDAFQQAAGVLVRVNASGQLLGREGQSQRFSSKQPIQLPKPDHWRTTALSLICLHRHLRQPTTVGKKVEQHCNIEMARPLYDCLSQQEQATCWFFFAFRPKAKLPPPPLSQRQSTQTCRIVTRPLPSEPESTSPKIRLLPEESTHPEETTPPEEATPPEETTSPEEAHIS